MTSQPELSYRLLERATEARCQCCPPDRVCAWCCVQGASLEDVVIGAVLEQSQDWALERRRPAEQLVGESLWQMFNA